MDFLDHLQFENPRDRAKIDQQQARMRDVILDITTLDSKFVDACLQECGRIQCAVRGMTRQEQETTVIHLAPHSALFIAILAMYGWNQVTEQALQEAKDGKVSPG